MSAATATGLAEFYRLFEGRVDPCRSAPWPPAGEIERAKSLLGITITTAARTCRILPSFSCARVDRL